MSRIGKLPIPVPSGVEVTIDGRNVTVKGPKGTLSHTIVEPITVSQADGALLVERPNDERDSKARHGLTRSLRITHENLQLRDPAFVGRLDRWFAAKAANQSGQNVAIEPPPPPMFTPFRLRDLVLPNRVVVSPMCQYSAEDGLPNDWHLVHLGSRAIGGAGLVITEMTKGRLGA